MLYMLSLFTGLPPTPQITECLLYKKIMLYSGEIKEKNGVLGELTTVGRRLPKEKMVLFVLRQPRLSNLWGVAPWKWLLTHILCLMGPLGHSSHTIMWGCNDPGASHAFIPVFCVSLLRRTLVIAFWAHPKSRMISSQDAYLITSAKTVFLSKAHSEVLIRHKFCGDTIQPVTGPYSQRSKEPLTFLFSH